MRSNSETMDQLREEIRRLCDEFAARLAASRKPLAAAGIDVGQLLTTTSLFEGPAPAPLDPGAVASDARLFRTAIEMLRSICFAPGGEVCQIGSWDGITSWGLLRHSCPKTFHLFDGRFDHLDPAVRADRAICLHEGNPADLIQGVADGSLDYALMAGAVSYAESNRCFSGILPKLKPGGHLHVRNYTGWSIFSGIPYGIPSIVNDLANRGDVRMVGFAPNHHGYHEILLRKEAAVPAGSTRSGTADRRVSPLHFQPHARSPLLATIPRPTDIASAPAPDDDAARLSARISRIACELIPSDAVVVVAASGETFPLELAGRSTRHFALDLPGADAPEDPTSTAARLGLFRDDGCTHLVIPATSFPWLDRHPAFSAYLRRSFGVVTLDADCVILALGAPSQWADLDAFLKAFREREGRHPAILDWATGQDLGTVFPDLPVFSHEATAAGRLPHVDASVDVVVIPPGDAAPMTEARRVATAAVVEIGTVPPGGAVRIAMHSPVRAEQPAASATGSGRPRPLPLADRRILICSHHLPQPDFDSYSRRLFHFVGFLREAGCDVTCIADSPAGHDAFAGLLTERGVRVLIGLDPQQAATLAGEMQFDWALLGLWPVATKLITRLREAAPKTRLVVDSGDIHFLRTARGLLRDADGTPGHLDADFAGAAAREIDIYAAADGVLAVSQKEADFIGALIGDSSRAFTVPDSEESFPSLRPFAARRGMLFTGNFAHSPNPEALDHLCQRILPHLDPGLLAEHPLYVVGSNMPESVRAIATEMPAVRIVGWVPTLAPYLARVRTSLIPLLHGAGTKRKMIQSLSMGTPAVTTSIGIEGFPLADDREVIVADDPVAFASGITRLLTDEALWRRLAAAGRETILAGHSHAVARERLLAVLEAVRTAPRRRPSRPAAEKSTPAVGVGPASIPFRGLAEGHAVTRPRTPAGCSDPQISIVIPTRNRAHLLREALGSLVAQSADHEAFEVVVVNDGSTDTTADVCREFAARLRLTQVDLPASGIGTAKNVGIDVAAADLVLFFDDDDLADPGLVAAHLAAHRRYPLEHVAVLGFTDWHERLVKTDLMRYLTDIGHDLFSYTYLQDGQVLDYTWFWGGRSSCKKSLIRRAGGFRRDFTFGSEDIEAGYRISGMVAREHVDAGVTPGAVGLAVVFCRDAVQHVIRPITYDVFCRRCELQGRSQWQFSRFYDDPAVQDWCQVEGARARWDEMRDMLAGRVARVQELEQLAAGARDADRRHIRDELHQLYRWTFDAFKIRGIVSAFHEAQDGMRDTRI